MSWVTWQMIPHFPAGPVPWALGSVIVASGIGSAVLGLEALLNPVLQESGVVTLNAGFSSESGLHVLLIPFPGESRGSCTNSSPHLARGNPIDGMPQAIPGELETAAGTVPTIVDSQIGSAATAIQSKATAVIQGAENALKNVSLGTKKSVGMGLPNCKALPFDISSVLPPGASEVLGDTLAMVQRLETTIFGTLRNSLIVGVTLVVCFGLSFGLTLRLLKCLSTARRRAAVTLVGFSCLVIPFLVSTVTITLLQSRVQDSVSHNAVLSSQKGDAWKYCVGAFVSALCMLSVCVYTTFLP